jgi:hypothetical protein
VRWRRRCRPQIRARLDSRVWSSAVGGAMVDWWARRGGGREGGDLGFRGNDVGAFYTCDIGRVSGEGR